MLLGDCGGLFKTGCFTQLDGKRPINALFYATLLGRGQECGSLQHERSTRQKVRRRDRSAQGSVGMSRVGVFWALLILSGMSSVANAETYTPGQKVDGDFGGFARPFLLRHCVDCHGETEPEGNLSLHDPDRSTKSMPRFGRACGLRSP